MTSKAARISIAQERTFWVVLTLLSVLILSYCLLVRATIMAAVEKEAIGDKSSELSVQLGGLGEQYLTMTNELTLNKATALGLSPTNDVIYIARGSAPVLSFNER